MYRREFLRRAASTAAALSVAGTATAAPRYQSQPDDVTLTYDRDRLQQYRPLLDVGDVDPVLQDSLQVFGWIAESESRETDCYCYWAYYPYQSGYTGSDSHVPDREPVYVFVADDEVEEITYDAYHYLAFTDPNPRTFRETHPWLYVIAPWHPYRRPTQSESTDTAQFLDVEDMHDWYGPWLRNDWAVHEPAVVNPWTIQNRGHWWATSPEGQLQRVRAGINLQIAQVLGVGSFAGSESDLVDSEGLLSEVL